MSHTPHRSLPTLAGADLAPATPAASARRAVVSVVSTRDGTAPRRAVPSALGVMAWAAMVAGALLPGLFVPGTLAAQSPAPADTPVVTPTATPTVAQATLEATGGVSEALTGRAAARTTVPRDSGGAAERVLRFRSRRDSLQYVAARAAADRSSGFRVLISLHDRQLMAVDGVDTLLVAPVAVGMDTTITFKGQSWRFETPRGRRTVLRKEKDPVWIPPVWHYAEVAAKRGLELATLVPGRPVKVGQGRILTVRGGKVGLILPEDSSFAELPVDEEIIFGDTLYIPPANTENRRIPGELGRFRLDMGNGYLLHGTPYEDSVGQNATHGCIRLYDEDIEWLYTHVPVGTSVFIY